MFARWAGQEGGVVCRWVRCRNEKWCKPRRLLQNVYVLGPLCVFGEVC